MTPGAFFDHLLFSCPYQMCEIQLTHGMIVIYFTQNMGQAFGAVQKLPIRVLPSSTLTGRLQAQAWAGSNH